MIGDDNLAYLSALFGEEMGIRNIVEREFLSDDWMYVAFLNQRHHVANLIWRWIIAVKAGKINPGRNILNRIEILQSENSA